MSLLTAMLAFIPALAARKVETPAATVVADPDLEALERSRDAALRRVAQLADENIRLRLENARLSQWHEREAALMSHFTGQQQAQNNLHNQAMGMAWAQNIPSSERVYQNGIALITGIAAERDRELAQRDLMQAAQIGFANAREAFGMFCTCVPGRSDALRNQKDKN